MNDYMYLTVNMCPKLEGQLAQVCLAYFCMCDRLLRPSLSNKLYDKAYIVSSFQRCHFLMCLSFLARTYLFPSPKMRNKIEMVFFSFDCTLTHMGTNRQILAQTIVQQGHHTSINIDHIITQDFVDASVISFLRTWISL